MCFFLSLGYPLVFLPLLSILDLFSNNLFLVRFNYLFPLLYFENRKDGLETVGDNKPTWCVLHIYAFSGPYPFAYLPILLYPCR